MAALLAACIMLGSFSVVAGLCINPNSDRLEISLDVCHPLQAPNVATTVPIARPASALSAPVIVLRGAVVEQPIAKLIDFVFTPDPPPPKSLA